MKISKKVICSVLAVVLLASCMIFAGCEVSTDHLIKNYEGTYTYKSAVDTANNAEYDYANSGNLRLVIRDGKAVFRNDASGSKGFVYYLQTSILGSSLKLQGESFYVKDSAAKGADYVFGSANFEGDELVVKLMFVDYAKDDNSTELKCAITVTFEKV